MDLFKLLGTVAIETDPAKKELDDVTDKAEKSEGKMSKSFSKLGSAAVKVGKVVATGMVAAGTAIAGLVASSVKAYAEYEQLVGGVETLFKDSSAKVMEYANNAYKTAGMSANAYMETVTSFSASLLQSLGGDTELAADVANKAITDMSDNANKMGTDMGMIQNAYNGFAKQNYTMLDNLKLGYGGTQEEMKRLLADASKLAGVEFDISSYADVIEAIHVIQTDMGITGTTAKEAAETISGSFATMKGAWTNLITAIASGENVTEYIGYFVDSASTLIGNVLPVAEQALVGVVQLVKELAPKIISVLPGLIASLVPAVIDATIGLFNALIDALPGFVNMLVGAVPALVEGIKSICYSLIDALPTIMPILIEGAILITLGIVEALPEICAALIEAIPSIMMSIASGFLKAAPEMYESFTRIWNNIKEKAVGMSDRIRESVRANFEKLKTNCADELTFLKNKATEIFENIKSAISTKIEKARDIVKNAIDKIKGFFNFKFKWPDLPMPHFRVSPSGWKVGDLLKGSIPKLGIDWYAKAMENPMIMNKPTIFGYDASTGQLMGGGDAGSEVVTGTGTLMEMIASVVASKNTDLINVLVKILAAITGMDENMASNLREAMEGTTFEVDRREFGRLVKAVG